ncbi:MAG: putative glycoside hydrolase, partial [Leptospiraceae bacterium]|nr:putative glycoside hydrolase [Leptospiraceae bacterium]
IRFPSDGPIARCRFRHKTSELYHSEALENFLSALRQATPLPLGADIYGYNGMYRVPGAIGQDLEVYGRILDIISPMHYSSHFGDDFMREYPRDERAYRLLYLALARGSFFAQGRFILRPYLQAFPMKNGIWGYGKKYFTDQIRGAADGGGDGFMFWGQLDHMALVRKSQME